MDILNRKKSKLIRTLTGHADPVNACTVSPDGSFIVSAAGNVMKIYDHKNDNTLKIWDFQTGALRFTLSGHIEAVKGCAVSSDCSKIVSVAEDCMIVWNANTGLEINRFDTPGFACSVCTDESTILIISFFIVSGSDNGNLTIWDAR
jgi:WD40 repeat protein